ncbi:MAG: adenine deaminase [Firmicutes bacterium]|nr:adenine deaminase [Bacillota bacterium]
MKTLLYGGQVVNVFTDQLETANVLIEDDRVIGVGEYTEADADQRIDVTGKVICPGFIDGHIHIESTMLTPAELARTCVPHGTTTIVADPHEIANVAGVDGIRYMLEASEGLPMTVYVMLPSCVPATPFDESGAVLTAGDLRPLYDHPRVLGLAEMMNFPGVLAGAPDVLGKLNDARKFNKNIDGHAPLLSGKALDQYISCGVKTEHEGTSEEEGRERIRKGQWLMIRQGTAAKNLKAMLPLMEEPWNRRCLFVTDDRHPADLLNEGQIDHIIRLSIAAGKPALTAIRMATFQAAQCHGLRDLGAVAPGYKADLLVLDDLEDLAINQVFKGGVLVSQNGKTLGFEEPQVNEELEQIVRKSFHLDELKETDFDIPVREGKICRVIKVIPGQLLTEEWMTEVDGIDLDRDILKLAVIERHNHTGHKGLGYLHGTGLKQGAIAASVSHDSHNLIVLGTNEADMAFAGNRLREIGGGSVVVVNSEVLAEMRLPIAGLMSDREAGAVAAENEALRQAVHEHLGTAEGIEPFMNLNFVSLAVIPHLKMTTHGLVDVDKFQLVPLYE